MYKILTLIIAIYSGVTLSNPSVFGMEIGKMTEKELKAKYNASKTGINKYTNGNMYSIPVSGINFDGLKEVTAIFDRRGKLVGVLTTLPKSKFNYLNDALKNKYTVVSQNIPFVGNKSVVLREGKTEITLEAPHMSFDMTMNYLEDSLIKAFKTQSQAEANRKKQQEASQL